MGRLDRMQNRGQRNVAGTLFEIWGKRGWPNVNVVGESFYTTAIRALLGPAKLPAEGKEVMTRVHLVHDVANRHDRNAIEVRGSTGLLGHLSREDAARYAPAIDSLQRQGLIPTTTARVWGGAEGQWDTGKKVFVGSVRVDLPEPHMMVPRNRPPEQPHQLLPVGSPIRVSAVEGSADATSPYLCREGECWVHATLHEVVERGPRSSKQLAEARIDGRAVGRLTPRMSGDMLPAVRFLTERGFVTAVRAIVKGNQLKCEVILYSARASELPQEWVNELPESAQQTTPRSEATRQTAGDANPLGPADSTEPPAPVPVASEVPAAPAQGWYADPFDVARLRWWDGSGWTKHTAP